MRAKPRASSRLTFICIFSAKKRFSVQNLALAWSCKFCFPQVCYIHLPFLYYPQQIQAPKCYEDPIPLPNCEIVISMCPKIICPSQSWWWVELPLKDLPGSQVLLVSSAPCISSISSFLSYTRDPAETKEERSWVGRYYAGWELLTWGKFPSLFAIHLKQKNTREQNSAQNWFYNSCLFSFSFCFFFKVSPNAGSNSAGCKAVNNPLIPGEICSI